jgi:3-oxoacyl-[acyl-carrier protein] reductase
MKLQDKVAVITGAASSIGMGRAMALAFAREGADVVVCDIDHNGVKERALEVEALGRKSMALKTDVSSSSMFPN